MICIAIDIGTSAAKVVAFDESGRICARARENYPTQRPRPGWAEQRAEDWWAAVSRAVKTVMQRLRGRKQDVVGIGLTGQMHGLVMLGSNGKPLMPCLIWMDSRAVQEARAFSQSFGNQRLLLATGNPPVPAFPAFKLLWVRNHLPAVFKKIRWILMPKDFIAYCLTKTIGTDASDASGTFFYNLQKRDWDDEILFAAGVDYKKLPPILSSTSVIGKITVQAAKKLSLPVGLPVVVGAGDLVTGALGIGITSPQRIGLILGTAGQLLFVAEKQPRDLLGNFYFFAHAVPNQYLGLGTVPTGGAAFSWVAQILGLGKNINELLNLAIKAPAGADGLLFLPYLAGTGTPYMDYETKGAFLGLSEAHSHKHIARATVEGVGYALRDSLQLLINSGLRGSHIMAAGGSMRSKILRRLLADILAHPLHIVQGVDASPFGAFLLTLVGLGFAPTIETACNDFVKVKEIVMPTEAHCQYDRSFELFKNWSEKWRLEFRVHTNQ